MMRAALIGLLAAGLASCGVPTSENDWFDQGQTVSASAAWIGTCRLSVTINSVPGGVRGRTMVVIPDTPDCRK